jgi:hypothetical protein
MFTVAAVAAVAIIAACKASDSTNPAPPILSGVVRVLHADPTSGPLDVYIDQTKVAGGIAFGADTVVSAVQSGQHTVTIYAAGTTTNPLASHPVQISNGIHYDFIVSGGTAGGTQLVGGLSEPGDNHLSANGALRLFDGIDTTDIGLGAYGVVNVSLTGNNPNNTYSFSKLSEFGSAPTNGSGMTGYADIAPDTYQILVTDTLGVDTAAIGQVTLGAGQLRTIIFTSQPPPTGKPPGTWVVLPDSN